MEISHRVDDVRNITHPTEGTKLRQRRMIILGMHRPVDVARRHRQLVSDIWSCGRVAAQKVALLRTLTTGKYQKALVCISASAFAIGAGETDVWPLNG